MSRRTKSLTDALTAYIDAARAAFQPLVDRKPWTEIAVNPAPLFREVIDKLEEGESFAELGRAFHSSAFSSGLVSKPPPDDSEGGSYAWKLRSFLRNFRLYDDLIIGKKVDAAALATALINEAGRTDVIHKDVGYLENIRCEAAIIVPGAFAIRKLTADEVEHFFCGYSDLDRVETPEATRRALAAEWFVVVERSSKPLSSLLVFPGAIGLHDFQGSPIPDINLTLNLFNAAAGPAIIRRTYHLNTTLFCHNRSPRPSYSDDLHPGSWGGPSSEPPQLFHYELTAGDAERLPRFWKQLDEVFLSKDRYFPIYLHRAISSFLHACAWNREEREFRQLRYVMAIEALYAGDDDERPTYFNERRRQIEPSGIKETLARCGSALIAPDKTSLFKFRTWLRDLYRQRSDIAHANTFEQESFVAQAQDPDEHHAAQELAKFLNVDSKCIWDGPDIEFAVLHNIVRESILMFIEHSADVLRQPSAAAITQELDRNESGFHPPRPVLERRIELRQQLQDRFGAARRDFLQQVNDAFERERDRLSLRASVRSVFWGAK